MSKSIGVATVTYNTGDTLGALLSSIPGATSGPAMVVVADNNSSDAQRVREIALRHGASFIARASNDGYGAGIDAAIQSLPVDTDYVLITNADVVLGPNSIDALVEAAERNPTGGSFGPRILDSTGNTYPSARTLPSLRTGIGHALFAQVRPSNRWTRRYRLDQRSDITERDAGWLSGACLLVRKSAFDAIGGFDHAYFMYFEDVDLGARFGRNGWQNVYVPQAVVTHSGAHSTSQNSRAMEKIHHKSAYLYLSRKYSAWYLWPLRVVLNAGLRARAWWITR